MIWLRIIAWLSPRFLQVFQEQPWPLRFCGMVGVWVISTMLILGFVCFDVKHFVKNLFCKIYKLCYVWLKCWKFLSNLFCYLARNENHCHITIFGTIQNLVPVHFLAKNFDLFKPKHTSLPHPITMSFGHRLNQNTTQTLIKPPGHCTSRPHTHHALHCVPIPVA